MKMSWMQQLVESNKEHKRSLFQMNVDEIYAKEWLQLELQEQVMQRWQWNR